MAAARALPTNHYARVFIATSVAGRQLFSGCPVTNSATVVTVTVCPRGQRQGAALGSPASPRRSDKG